MLWTVIFYFLLPVGQYEGPLYKSSFQYLASLSASLWWSHLFREENRGIQEESWTVQLLGGNAFPFHEEKHCSFLCATASRRGAAVIFPTISSCLFHLSELKAACQSWLIPRGMSYSSACLGTWTYFSWSSVLKDALCINGGGCPLSSTPFESPGIWLPKCSSVEEFAGINLVVVVTELPIASK